MEIQLSQFAGFCDGVKRAYEMIAGLDMKKIKKPVFILGSLVHNPAVIKKIEEKGIQKIDIDFFLKLKSGEIGTLIITAHGSGPEIFEAAKAKKIEIIDTTCPRVIRVQRLAAVYKKRGYKIILIGDKGHKEVVGIDEWAGKDSIIVSNEEDFKNIKLKSFAKIAVLAQTTQSRDFFEKVSLWIRKKFPDVGIISTICHATFHRQEEIKKMASKSDLVVVIGSKESANSKRLFEIARAINSRSHFIETDRDLKKHWFLRAEKVSVSAGASTPVWIIEKVIKKLSSI